MSFWDKDKREEVESRLEEAKKKSTTVAEGDYYRQGNAVFQVASTSECEIRLRRVGLLSDGRLHTHHTLGSYIKRKNVLELHQDFIPIKLGEREEEYEIKEKTHICHLKSKKKIYLDDMHSYFFPFPKNDERHLVQCKKTRNMYPVSIDDVDYIEEKITKKKATHTVKYLV